MIPELDAFVESLPDICRCADAKNFTLYRRKQYAIKKRYLNPNHANQTEWIVQDIDRSNAFETWMDANVPKPNIVAINPANGHAHYFYHLAVPVHRNPRSNFHVMRYLSDVDLRLTCALQADPAYQGGLAKNPLHPDWETYHLVKRPYLLSELEVTLPAAKARLIYTRESVLNGESRHCDLFNSARFYAYGLARTQRESDYASIYAAVLDYCDQFNRNFADHPDGRLPAASLRATAKSIAQFVCQRMTAEGFKESQAAKGRKSGEVRAAAAQKKIEMLMELKAAHPDATQRVLSEISGIPQATINRLLAGVVSDPGTISVSTRRAAG